MSLKPIVWRRVAGTIIIAITAGLPIGFVTAQTDHLRLHQPAVTPWPTSTPFSGSVITYTVQRDDTFTAIAHKFNLTPDQLLGFNQIDNINLIEAGQVLIVDVTIFTLTPTPTDTIMPDPTSTPAPTVMPTITPLPARTRAAPRTPTTASVARIASATTSTIKADYRPVSTSPASSDVPIDVIIVGGLMALSIVGLVVGFRMQHG